jgi:predicted Zn-ribbon and HTH transcriptional regulator
MMHDLAYYATKNPIVNNDIRYMPEATKQQLLEQTSNCIDGTIRERLYWLQNRISIRPNCKHCGNPLSAKGFVNGVTGYRDFCSRKCMANSEQVAETGRQTSLAKFGVPYAMMSPELKQKREQTNLLVHGDKHPYRWSGNAFKQAMLDTHGVTSPLLNPAIRQRVSQSLRKGYIETGKLDERLAEIEKLEDVILEDEYTSFDIEMQWVHTTCGARFMSNPANGKIPRCPKCKAKSLPEYELFKTVEELVGVENIHRNDRNLIAPYELDVYVPDKKIAFEMNGTYYHSELFLKERAKEYHIIKQELCRAAGVQLIHIFEDEWYEKRAFVIDKLENMLGSSKRIFARNLSIVKLNGQTKNIFLNKNHIQGQDIASVSYGLIGTNETLYAVMTFCKPRFSNKYEWELSRFANERGISVVGGASKLLKAFTREYKPKSIITYADARFSNGNFYKTLGFSQLRKSVPNYRYVKGDSLISRYQAQKHLLPKLLGEKFDPNLSEHTNMNNAGWYRLYDCGNYVFYKEYAA